MRVVMLAAMCCAVHGFGSLPQDDAGVEQPDTKPPATATRGACPSSVLTTIEDGQAWCEALLLPPSLHAPRQPTQRKRSPLSPYTRPHDIVVPGTPPTTPPQRDASETTRPEAFVLSACNPEPSPLGDPSCHT